ncbi:hypothetical protein ZIOFF_070156 [Zingiber officinale]|uniref:Piwi domain-containing protein n=1 Tax=Zingiber officinale TaxID=94328 RepID=A0A8J5BID7_ZINOF|nr:hypothetical protein ZIOFF_070156 [Zingiber officinale]
MVASDQTNHIHRKVKLPGPQFQASGHQPPLALSHPLPRGIFPCRRVKVAPFFDLVALLSAKAYLRGLWLVAFEHREGDLQYFRPAFCVVCKSNAKDATALSCLDVPDIRNDPVLHPLTAQPDHVERALSTRYHDAMTILKPRGKELDLLIVILPDNNGSLYVITSDQKQICKTGLGLVSQCCLTKHVFRMSKQYVANVGGRDTILVDALSRHIPLVSDRPTIIFGADVTDPHPGEDFSPSIAVILLTKFPSVPPTFQVQGDLFPQGWLGLPPRLPSHSHPSTLIKSSAPTSYWKRLV